MRQLCRVLSALMVVVGFAAIGSAQAITRTFTSTVSDFLRNEGASQDSCGGADIGYSFAVPQKVARGELISATLLLDYTATATFGVIPSVSTPFAFGVEACFEAEPGRFSERIVEEEGYDQPLPIGVETLRTITATGGFLYSLESEFFESVENFGFGALLDSSVDLSYVDQRGIGEITNVLQELRFTAILTIVYVTEPGAQALALMSLLAFVPVAARRTGRRLVSAR